jgi:hypothetical protein
MYEHWHTYTLPRFSAPQHMPRLVAAHGQILKWNQAKQIQPLSAWLPINAALWPCALHNRWQGSI